MIRSTLFTLGLAASLTFSGKAEAQSCYSPLPDTALSVFEREELMSAISDRPKGGDWRERIDDKLETVLNDVSSEMKEASLDDSGADLTANTIAGLDVHDSDLGATDSYLYDAEARAGDIRAEAFDDANYLFDEAQAYRAREEAYQARQSYRGWSDATTTAGSAPAGDFRRSNPRAGCGELAGPYHDSIC